MLNKLSKEKRRRDRGQSRITALQRPGTASAVKMSYTDNNGKTMMVV